MSLHAGGPQAANAYARNLIQPAFDPTKFYPLYSGTRNAVAISGANLLLLYPFEIVHPLTVASLSIYVTSGGAGSAVKMAVYAAGTNGRPLGAPLASTTGAATTGTGAITEAITPVVIQPQLVFAGGVFTGTLPTVHTSGGTSFESGRLIGITALATNAMASLSIAQTYGDALPTFTGAESFTENMSTTVTAPIIFAKGS